jgi:hypothetical protein
VEHTNIAKLNLVADEVNVDLDVLRAAMLNWVCR